MSAALDPDFQLIKARIIEVTGQHYYADKDELLFDKVRRRVLASGCRSFRDYGERLGQETAGAAEWAALISDLTVGETFFFRYAEQFEALRRSILPQLIERNGASRTLRIWSAGCATGAEPYSLAILVDELLGPALLDWRVSILGTDINSAFLAAAETGLFGAWALRSLNAGERENYFDPGGRPNAFRVKGRYRAFVRFQAFNILRLLDGGLPLDYADFDLILCRNVLIYFHPDKVPALIAGLAGTLKPGGWLLLGHAEANPATMGDLKAVDFPGTAAYRRPMPGEAPPGPSAVPPPDLPARRPAPVGRPMPPRRPEFVRPEFVPLPAVRAMRPAPPPGEVDALLRSIRESAGRGDLDAAAAACRRGLALDPVRPAFHYYDGLVEQARAHGGQAAAALRRALYLDRRFVMAHYQLGLVLVQTGDAAAGRRSLAAAARAAAALPPADPLPEGDGLTAGALRDCVRLVLGGTEAS